MKTIFILLVRIYIYIYIYKAHDDQREEDRLMQFLMGLNDSYNTVRSNILMMSPLPNVRQAYSLVIQEETQRQMSSETT